MSDVTDIKMLVEDAASQPLIKIDQRGRDIAFVPKGEGSYDMEVLTAPFEVLPKPAYISQRPSLQTTKSLMTYVSRFKTDDTMLFADVNSSTIVAVIDYHKAGSTSPGLVTHQATLTLPHSLEWQAWLGKNDRLMEQKVLAEFVQDNYRDFKNPLGLDMLELVLDMEKTAVMHVGRKMKRAGSDKGNVDMSTEISGTDLPPEWTISIPVYRGEDTVDIVAYCREKLVDSNNLMGYKLATPERVKEDAFFDIANRVAVDTGVPIVLGVPGIRS